MDNAISGYRRSLDLENAVSTVEFTSGGTKYTREAIVSNPDQVIALKYSKKGSGKISFDVNFATEETNGGTGTVTAGENYLEWDARYTILIVLQTVLIPLVICRQFLMAELLHMTKPVCTY